MYGFACNETDGLMPAPIWYAHQLAKQLHTVRTQKKVPYLRPDGKTQVSITYDENGDYWISTIVLSTQHDPDISQEQIKADMLREVILPVAGDRINANTLYHINPTGLFII